MKGRLRAASGSLLMTSWLDLIWLQYKIVLRRASGGLISSGFERRILETVNPTRAFPDYVPSVNESCLIDETSVVIGEVSLVEDVPVWPCVVLRGDVDNISVGKCSSVQDGSALHVSHKNMTKPDGPPLITGDDVTIGYEVMLHDCQIGSRMLVGMESITLDDTVVEDDVMIGADSLVSPREQLESSFLYAGSSVR